MPSSPARARLRRRRVSNECGARPSFVVSGYTLISLIVPHQQHLPARAEYALPEATPAGPAAPDGGSVAELESEEETAPTLATAPVEALPGAELAPALLALQGAAEADNTALSLLLALTRAGRLPQPASVAHRHPLAPQPLTAQQQRSLNNWLSDSHSHSFPTRGSCASGCR